MKIKAETFAKELTKRNGLERATHIAENRARGSNPKEWVNLPHGVVFFHKDKRGNTGMNEKHLKNLHNWWVQVFHVLKKLHVK